MHTAAEGFTFVVMTDVDYIVVGLGIAGISACARLIEEGKDFVVFDTAQQTATRVAGGVVNPVVLKRFTPVWEMNAFMNEALPFYKRLSRYLDCSFIKELPINRVLTNPKEQNDWMVASDKKILEPYLSARIGENKNAAINAPYGFGEVLQAFKLDTPTLLNSFRDMLQKTGRYIDASFQYQKLKLTDTGLAYGDIKAKRIILCEGSAALKNPFFPPECLIPKKGEYLIIKAPDLQLSSVLKGPFFIIPLGDHIYKVGATFVHGDNTFLETNRSKEQIENALRKMISCEFEIISQLVGMRPTVKDRRPIVGKHIKYAQIAFLNGLGTRGILIAPRLSKLLHDHLEHGLELPKDVRIDRFLG